MHPLLKHITIRYFQLALLCFICVAKSYGQTVTKHYGRIDVEFTKEKKPKKIYTKVEIKSTSAEDSSLVRFVEKNVNRSIAVSKRVKKGKYIASVEFIIDKEGNVADVRCVNDPGFGMCEEVLRVVKKYSIWRPGSSPVRSYRRSSTTPQENN